jgi:hypothetical protein
MSRQLGTSTYLFASNRRVSIIFQRDARMKRKGSMLKQMGGLNAHTYCTIVEGSGSWIPPFPDIFSKLQKNKFNTNPRGDAWDIFIINNYYIYIITLLPFFIEML